MGFGVRRNTPAGSDRPLMMSTSSSGSFQSSLYLLAVSITLAAVYLRGWRGWLSCTQIPSTLKTAQLAGTAPTPWVNRGGCPPGGTHRLMELRRREPDLRFNVVHTSRSVKRKKERSFFPPTAFCGVAGDTKGLMSAPLQPLLVLGAAPASVSPYTTLAQGGCSVGRVPRHHLHWDRLCPHGSERGLG